MYVCISRKVHYRGVFCPCYAAYGRKASHASRMRRSSRSSTAACCIDRWMEGRMDNRWITFLVTWCHTKLDTQNPREIPTTPFVKSPPLTQPSASMHRTQKCVRVSVHVSVRSAFIWHIRAPSAPHREHRRNKLRVHAHNDPRMPRTNAAPPFFLTSFSPAPAPHPGCGQEVCKV